MTVAYKRYLDKYDIYGLAFLKSEFLFSPHEKRTATPIPANGVHPSSVVDKWQHGLFYLHCRGDELCQTGPFWLTAVTWMISFSDKSFLK